MREAGFTRQYKKRSQENWSVWQRSAEEYSNRKKTSERFEVITGVRQGDSLSTLLFNLVLETTFKDTEIQTQKTNLQEIIHRRCGSKEDTRKHIQKWKKKPARAYRLRVNKTKTKFFVKKYKKLCSRFNTSLESYSFKKIRHFKYLKVTVTSNN